MASMGVLDSTVGAITDADTTDAGLKGTRDSSTAASEMAIAALKGAEGSSTVVPEMAIVAFTAEGISVEVPADSMGAAGATAADTGSFPEFLIS
jgi:hypothetical protein